MDLFWVSSAEDLYELVARAVSGETWVFDYLTVVEGYAPTEEYLYLLDLTNNDKLIKIRFYQIG